MLKGGKRITEALSASGRIFQGFFQDRSKNLEESLRIPTEGETHKCGFSIGQYGGRSDFLGDDPLLLTKTCGHRRRGERLLFDLRGLRVGLLVLLGQRRPCRHLRRFHMRHIRRCHRIVQLSLQSFKQKQISFHCD